MDAPAICVCCAASDGTARPIEAFPYVDTQRHRTASTKGTRDDEPTHTIDRDQHHSGRAGRRLRWGRHSNDRDAGTNSTDSDDTSYRERRFLYHRTYPAFSKSGGDCHRNGSRSFDTND
jgi:hypothetical protein